MKNEVIIFELYKGSSNQTDTISDLIEYALMLLTWVTRRGLDMIQSKPNYESF
jgi:hypothetical protein